VCVDVVDVMFCLCGCEGWDADDVRAHVSRRRTRGRMRMARRINLSLHRSKHVLPTESRM
jgi:hypothetical protein